MDQFANVRTKTIKFVTTVDLMMACAKHHSLTGNAFKTQISDFWGLLDQVHAALVNDHIPGYRQAADWPLYFVAGGLDINMYAFFAAKALESKGDDSKILRGWLTDLFMATQYYDNKCALSDHYVIVNHLPEIRDTKGFKL